MRAELFRRPAHEIAVVHSRGVDRHLVGTGHQQIANIIQRAHAAADRDRHEAMLGGFTDHIEDDAAVFVASGDVEEAELVRTCFIVCLCGFHWIASIDQIDEVHALDDATVLDVEAWDDAGFERHLTLLSGLSGGGARQ